MAEFAFIFEPLSESAAVKTSGVDIAHRGRRQSKSE
jgi:hypothetical protein